MERVQTELYDFVFPDDHPRIECLEHRDKIHLHPETAQEFVELMDEGKWGEAKKKAWNLMAGKSVDETCPACRQVLVDVINTSGC